MRLLHFDSSQNLIVSDFSRKCIPPYAILSHRWGIDEVLLEDVKDGSYTRKKGCQKIDFCAGQAAKDQLDHFWIDTCCIDKWNLRELSQAINSMYRWYQSAAKCYVFLSDVSVPDAAYAHQQDVWEGAFRISEWHTRGWTLQELIAPSSVEFFSLEGFLLGNKRSLGNLLCAISGIPAKALHGEALESFSIYQRMKWASSRRTSEPEDNAYCLLGILGISMPSAYGEGGEKALARLRAEIESVHTVPFSIPFSRNARFVGREAELAELERKVSQDGEPHVIAISGSGGTGKTQLALELAYISKENHKEMLVFWIDASDADSLYQAYTRIAQKLDIKGWNDEDADLELLIKIRLSRETRNWLLILDNFDSSDAKSGEPYITRDSKLVQSLPQSALGCIVLTTTNHATAQTLAKEDVLQLHAMTPDAAQRMLENQMLDPISASDRHEIEPLLERLLYLPLAIVQAAAYLSRERITLQGYKSLLVQKKYASLDLSKGVRWNNPEKYAMTYPVTVTLLISLDQIRLHHPAAAETLFLMACVDRKDIPLSLLEASIPCENGRPIAILNEYGLITRRPAESAVEVHQLVHNAIREWLQGHELVRTRTELAMKHLLEVFPDDHYGNRSKWRRLRAHVTNVLSCDQIPQESADRIDLAQRCARTLYSDGRYEEAEGLQVQVKDTRYRTLGVDHLDTLQSIASLALTYWRQGRWTEAEDLHTKVTEKRQAILGAHHLDTLTSMANLASTYWKQGQLTKAEELYTKVMEERQAILGANHPDVLTSIASVASTYRDQGRWKEAVQLNVQIVDRREAALGQDHPDTLSSKGNLAVTYHHLGQWKEAEEIEVKMMERTQATLGPDHPNTLVSIANLASTYWDQGRLAEAEKLEVEVMERRLATLGPIHPSTLVSIANLASTYRDQGRWEEAEELDLQAAQRREATLGPTHPDTLISMNNLAATYGNQGRFKDAEEIQVKVMERSRATLGPDHPFTFSSISNLASTYQDQRRWKEAEELNIQVRERREATLGPNHPETLTSINNIVATYCSQGRWKEAEQLNMQVLERRKATLGPDHPETLISIAKLAEIYWKQGQWKEAEWLQLQVIQGRIERLGKDHHHTISATADLHEMHRTREIPTVGADR